MTSPPGADARSSSSPSASERGGIHRGLDPLIDAGELARAEVVVLPVPMHRPTLPRAMRPVERSVEVLSYLAAHFRMVVQLWLRRDADLLLVREFLTPFLVLCWPLIWPLRQRVVVLVTFNLQEAHRRRVARLALRLLHRGGCRFACLECSEGFAELALATPERPPLVLPHPIDPSIVAERVQRVGRVPVVGVVGRARGEKGFEELLTRLHRLRAEGRLAADVLLGCPERDVRERWRVRGVEVVDTTARQAYLRALDRCDVVVFSFARDR